MAPGTQLVSPHFVLQLCFFSGFFVFFTMEAAILLPGGK